MAIDLQEPDDVEHGNDTAGADEVELEHGQQVPGDTEPDQPDDAQAEADEEEIPEEIDAAEPEKPLSRGERRFQRLANEIKERDARLARLEQELTEVRTRQAPAQQQREPTQEEMALWTTDQILDYRLNKTLQPVLQQQNQLRFQMMDSADKAAYASLAATDARAKRLAQEVETAYADAIKNGQFVERTKILKYLIGDKVLSGAAPARERAQAAGQQRIKRQTASGSSARGDQPAQRGKLSPAEERLKRLENVTF